MNITEPLKSTLLFVLYIVGWLLLLFSAEYSREIPIQGMGLAYVYWWTYQWAKRNQDKNIWIYRLYYFLKWAFIFTVAYLFYGYFKEKISDKD